MTVSTALLILAVAALAAVGASARHLLADRLNEQLPFGTLLANAAASGALGLLSQVGEPWQTMFGLGALGALSAWSKAANEVAELARAGEGRSALFYLGATVSTSILAAWAGLQFS